jgi:prepilin-type N-terminal cleavage/methylation domain-containing protein
MSLPTRQTSHGFTLTELMVSVVLTSLGVMTFVPMVEQRVKQTTVDSYTSKIESGIIQMKANMVSRQGSCRIALPNGSGTETEITAKALESLVIDDDPNDPDAWCPPPTTDMGGLSMKPTSTRFLNIKNSLSEHQHDDIRLLITPAEISMNTIGGVTAPEASFDPTPLTIRIRSRGLESRGKGLERCLQLEVMTGTLIRGTWKGSNFDTGQCTQS